MVVTNNIVATEKKLDLTPDLALGKKEGKEKENSNTQLHLEDNLRNRYSLRESKGLLSQLV